MEKNKKIITKKKNILDTEIAGIQDEKSPLDLLLYNIRHYFEEYCSQIKIRNKEGALVPFELNSIQRKFIQNFHTRNIVVKPRQIGFSTLCMALMGFIASFTDHFVIGVLYQDTKMSGANGDKVQKFLEFIGRNPIDLLGKKVAISINSDIRSREKFIIDPNETLFLFDSAGADNPFRSQTIQVLWGSEAGYWGNGTGAWDAVLPTLPDNGIMILESTASTRFGTFFKDQYVSAKADAIKDAGVHSVEDINVLDLHHLTTMPHFFSFFDFPGFAIDTPRNWIPNIDDIEFMSKYRHLAPEKIQNFAYFRRKKITERPSISHLSDFKSNYPIDDVSCFEDLEAESAFDVDKIHQMGTATQIDISRDPFLSSEKSIQYDDVVFRMYGRYENNLQFFLGVDTAQGSGGDSQAIVVLNSRNEISAVYQNNKLKYNKFGSVIESIARYYGNASILVEKNTFGVMVYDQLLEISLSHVEYYNTETLSKIVLISNVNSFVNKEENINDEALKSQLLKFSTKKEIAQHQKDDLVIALGLAYQCKLNNYSTWKMNVVIAQKNTKGDGWTRV